MLIKGQKYVVVKPYFYATARGDYVRNYNALAGDIVTVVDNSVINCTGNVDVKRAGGPRMLIHASYLIPYIGPDTTTTQPFTERDLADALKVLCIDTDAAKVYTLAQAIKEAR